MAITDTIFGSQASDIYGNMIGNTFMLIAILILCAVIIGVALYVRYLRQFNITVMIESTRSAGISGVQHNKIIFDKGGLIYNKKDKSWYFRLLKEKVDLPQPPFDVLQPSNKGNILRIWQKSNEEFIFLLPDKIDTQIIVRADGSRVPVGQLVVKQVEGDVSYWNQIRKRTNKKLFDTESMIMKLLPYIVPDLMFMLVIFMTWMVIKNFTVLADVAKSLENTANILNGTTNAAVITG